jgi:type IV pilus assembly protein PilV
MHTLSMRTVSGPTQSVRACHGGFSLVEVMVALIVMSVGLLGVAKMQALALSSTGNARIRSLAALEAASFASTMRADRNYWSGVTADPAVQFANGSITQTSDQTLAPKGANCPCTSPQLAYLDLQDWVTDLNAQVPGSQGTVNCTPPVAGTSAPVSCAISLSWPEHQVASNAQQAAQAQKAGAPALITYVLYVNP